MSDKATRIWFALFVLAVFVAGVASGLIVGSRLGWPPARPLALFPGMRFGLGPALDRPMVAEVLARELQLTEDQHARLVALLAERRKQLEQIRGDVRGRFEAEQQTLREAIEKILTPEQRERFREWIRRGPPFGPGVRGPRRGRPFGEMGPPPPP